MTSYVILMQFSNKTQLTEADESRLMLITQVGGAVTLIGCVLNLCLLCLLSLKGDGFFIIGNMCVVLMLAQLSFIGSENTGYPDPVMCKITTCLIQYFFLCVHFASFAYALHLWSKFGPGCLSSCRRRGLYLVIIWLLPVIIVMVTVVMRGDLYAKTSRCWLPGEQNTRLALLVPLGCVLLANGLLYLLILRYTIYLSMSRNNNASTILRQVSMTSLSLAPVLGLQWILGYAITFDGPKFLQYLFVILSSTQGMLILLFHVLTHGHVQKSLCEKIAIKDSDAFTPSTSGHNTVQSIVNRQDVNDPKDDPNGVVTNVPLNKMETNGQNVAKPHVESKANDPQLSPSGNRRQRRRSSVKHKTPDVGDQNKANNND